MKRAFAATFALLACGSRSDLTSTPSSPSPDASAPVSTNGVFCKPGDAMKVLALGYAVEPLVTDGTWLYADVGDGIAVMSCDGGPTTVLAQDQAGYHAAPSNGGIYFAENQELEWMQHDGSGKHVVLPIDGIVVPPVMYAFGTPTNVEISEYSLQDGSSHAIAKMADAFPFVNDAIAVTRRYLHVVVEQEGTNTISFVDHRVDRADGSMHDMVLLTQPDLGPFACEMPLIAPDAACMAEFCALDERDDAVTLPIPHACALLVDDEWAYYALPSGFSRVGLRSGTVETLIPHAAALAATEANGCLYVEAIFELNAPSTNIVRIPR